MKVSWLVYPASVIAVVAVVAGIDWWMKQYLPTPPTIIAQQSPQVAKLETKTIQPKQVVVLEPKAKAKLNLPKPVQQDTKQHVVSSSKVDYSLVPKTVTTVFDEDTGLFSTYEQDSARPWVASRDSGEASLSYGLKQGHPVTRLSVRQSIIQIKAADIGAVGTVDSDGEHFIGIGATYRW